MISLDEIRAGATLAVASIAASAPFALEWYRRRESRMKRIDDWVLWLNGSGANGRFSATLKYHGDGPGYLLERIELIKPRGAHLAECARGDYLVREPDESAWSDKLEFTTGGGGKIFDKGKSYDFELRNCSAMANKSPLTVTINVSASSISPSRRRTMFIVQSQPITLKTSTTASVT